MVNGLLLVDKPAGWTSFDAVNYIRKIVASYEQKKPMSIKVGHSGTLDPFATGLLLVLIGKDFTRQAAHYSKLDKVYGLTMTLGSTSSTGDSEGQIEKVSDLEPDAETVKKTLKNFTGKLLQTPPIYSAIKVDGQRAYKLARAGKEVKLEPRLVAVYSIELLDYAYPRVNLKVKVSSGTYIRSLVEDIGKSLSTGAYTSELRRTEIDRFNVTNAVQLDNLTIERVEQDIINEIK